MSKALVLTVALVVVVLAQEPPSRTAQDVARVFEQIERTCFTESQFTPQESSTVINVRKEAYEQSGSSRGVQDQDFLALIDTKAPSHEVAQGIRSKWNAFIECTGREAAKLVQPPPSP